MINLKRIFLGEMKYLETSSKSIVDVFTKTVNSLTAVNSNIDKSVISKEKAITKLGEDKDTLTKLKASNENIINKLNSIIKD